VAWVLVPCLVRLRAEFNQIAPARDHASDGSIGDAAHRAEVSDHNPDETGSVPIHDADRTNEVHAIDVDDDLRESDLTMEKVVQFLLGRCRSGAERRLRYIIYNRRIWSASSGWVKKAYTGSSPHTEHAHFSASYTTKREAGTASWHLEDIPVALTAADKTWISKQITGAVDDLLTVRIGDRANANRTVGDLLRDLAKLRGVLVGDEADTKNAALSPTAPLARALDAPAELDELAAKVDQILAAMTPQQPSR
jgi:hypothetical protein